MRLVHAVVAALLLALLAPPGVAATPSAEHKAQRPRVSITASPEWVRKGGIVTLTGTVKGVRGRASVTIFQKTKGKSWVVEAVKRTTRKGRFTHREDVTSGDRTYKACVKRACDSVLVHMGQQPKQSTAVSLTGQSASTVEAGQSFSVSGTASANLNGQQVQVQAYDGATSAWSAVSTAIVQGSQWATTMSVGTAGKAIPLRAVFSGGTGLSPSVSNQSAVAVYGWYYLEDLSTVEGSWDLDGAQRISGVTYPRSVGENDETIQVDLQRSCIRFSAAVGLDDSSASTDKSSIRLLTDSVERYANNNLTLGVGSAVAFDVTGALRFVFEPAGINDEPQIVLGDARVLCAF
ncbi:NPCBM/NEW2 domain-containing protein [Nocardioides KLBMP 9356]|uniref:NPCBM/NEW2 domain-containing protein n=1 Tax=Nocardioides potassii TaxID=2911371 RepID=A0ABS9HCY2_9ACTN|nr:NPCBM/NEW2 domain-containing protein [Nocardioides potassii]MCF6379042.1 NPCBM/NEW2 domain-containing protein [Nocardioides potassii]